MATYSIFLSEKIPWTEEPDGPHSPKDCKELDMTERNKDNVLKNANKIRNLLGSLSVTNLVSKSMPLNLVH